VAEGPVSGRFPLSLGKLMNVPFPNVLGLQGFSRFAVLEKA